jgi:FtsZ-binding cell division protein ZapB
MEATTTFLVCLDPFCKIQLAANKVQLLLAVIELLREKNTSLKGKDYEIRYDT